VLSDADLARGYFLDPNCRRIYYRQAPQSPLHARAVDDTIRFKLIHVHQLYLRV